MVKSLNMCGPYVFTRNEIQRVIAPKQIGNYALGYADEQGTFYVQYVGRSDGILRERLLEHLGDGKKYKHFKFSYAKNAREAYEKECRNYHDFDGDKGGLDNDRHPDRPDGTNYPCPYCDN